MLVSLPHPSYLHRTHSQVQVLALTWVPLFLRELPGGHLVNIRVVDDRQPVSWLAWPHSKFKNSSYLLVVKCLYDAVGSFSLGEYQLSDDGWV
jgi:hypothetical protein